MDEGVDEFTALQSENILKISRNVTRITEDDRGLKALLAASNDRCFIMTFNPHIRKHRDKWIMHLTRRQKKSCMKGKRINSTVCRTKIGAESELFEFRFSQESPEGKKDILERIKELKENHATVPSQINVNNAADNNTVSSMSKSPRSEIASDNSGDSSRKGFFHDEKYFLES